MTRNCNRYQTTRTSSRWRRGRRTMMMIRTSRRRRARRGVPFLIRGDAGGLVRTPSAPSAVLRSRTFVDARSTRERRLRGASSSRLHSKGRFGGSVAGCVTMGPATSNALARPKIASTQQSDHSNAVPGTATRDNVRVPHHSALRVRLRLLQTSADLVDERGMRRRGDALQEALGLAEDRRRRTDHRERPHGAPVLLERRVETDDRGSFPRPACHQV